MKSSYTLVLLAICLITTRVRGYSCPEDGVDFNGNDISDDYFQIANHDYDMSFTFTNLLKNTGELCEKSNNCLFWTYKADKSCFLKTSDAGLKRSSGHYSGVRGCK